MSTLTGQYISQSYGGIIQLSTNTGIVTGSNTQLQDGFGTNLGVYFDGRGTVVASDLTLTSSAANPSRFDFKTFSTTGLSVNQYVTESGLANIIYGSNTIMGTTGTNATASFDLSGSQNYINVSTLGSNINYNAGRRFGLNGRLNFVFSVPSVTGSNLTMSAINSTWLNAGFNVTNNWTSVGNIINSFVNNSIIATQVSGTISISNTNVNATTTLTNTWASSSLTVNTAQLLGSVTATTYTTASDSTSKALNVAANSILAGNTLAVYIKSGSASGGGVNSSIIVSNNFTVTGSAGTTGSAAIFGSWPVTDGVLNDLDNVRFVVGTGTGVARRTSLYVSSSGMTVVSDLNATGSLSGTASFAVSASWAPFTPTPTGSFATTGSNTFRGNQIISGSVNNEVRALTITSQTASLDLSTGNFFTLTLVSGSTTYLNPTNLQPGETVNLQITQASSGVGNLSFASSVSFPTLNAYTASIVLNAVDVISMVSFDGTKLRAVPSYLFI